MTRKERVEKISELDAGDNNSKEYKVEAIWDSAVYVNKSEGHLPGLHYLVAWKGYPEEENTWEPVSAVQHLRKLIRSFYQNHLKRPTATFLPINSALPMARPNVRPIKPNTKQKRGRPASNASKRAKKN